MEGQVADAVEQWLDARRVKNRKLCTKSLWWKVVKFTNQYSIPKIVLNVHPKKSKTIDHEWVERIGLSTKRSTCPK